MFREIVLVIAALFAVFMISGIIYTKIAGPWETSEKVSAPSAPAKDAAPAIAK